MLGLRKYNRFAHYFLRFVSFRLFGSVTASGDASVVHSSRIKLTAHNSVAKADVFHAAAAKKHHGVLLQIMADARNISGDFHAVCEADAGDFSDSGVRLFRSFGGHFDANAPFEGRGVKSRTIFNTIETTGKSRRL